MVRNPSRHGLLAGDHRQDRKARRLTRPAQRKEEPTMDALGRELRLEKELKNIKKYAE